MNISEVADLFVREDYKWSFKSGKRVPTAEEIEELIGRAMEALADEPSNSQLEVGRLVVRKYDKNKFDIFVHVMELNDGLASD